MTVLFYIMSGYHQIDDTRRFIKTYDAVYDFPSNSTISYIYLGSSEDHFHTNHSGSPRSARNSTPDKV